MCGIFGVYSNSLVVKSILDGLSKLEYRGYDSSGISILDQNKKIHTLRAKGKLEKLKIKLIPVKYKISKQSSIKFFSIRNFYILQEFVRQ